MHALGEHGAKFTRSYTRSAARSRSGDARPASEFGARARAHLEQAYGRADGPSASRSTATRLVLLRAREALDAPDWSIDIKVKVGAALLQQLLETARVPPLSAMRGADTAPAGWDASDDTPAFLHEHRTKSSKAQFDDALAHPSTGGANRSLSNVGDTAWRAQRFGYVSIHPQVVALSEVAVPRADDTAASSSSLSSAAQPRGGGEAKAEEPPPLPDIVSSLSSSLRYIPMLVPPRPWTRWDSGGYIRLKPRVMRTHGSSVQVEALKRARLDRVFEALNALGRVRWRVNAPALGAIEDAWARSLAIADLPSRHDLEVPSSLPSEEMKALRRAAETAREATLAAASEPRPPRARPRPATTRATGL